MTRQGLRDLNYYGPKRVPATTMTTGSVPVDEPAQVPAVVPVAEPVAVKPKDE